MIKGKRLTKGIASGKAYILKEKTDKIEIRENCDPEKEISRLINATAETRKELKEIRNRCLERLSEEESAIFDMHMMLLEDPILHAEIVDVIKTKKINAEAALLEVTDNYIRIFNENSDEYFKQRAADIIDVRDREIANLSKNTQDTIIEGNDVILVASELSPSRTILLSHSNIKAVVLASSSATSHSAIILKGLGIPALIGVENATSLIRNGQELIADTFNETIITDPKDEEKEEYAKISEVLEENEKISKEFIHKKTLTKDNHHISLFANISSPDEYSDGSEGIGLFRTEFLFMSRDSEPDEEEQFEAYRTVLLNNRDREVIIRTLDIGGDKKIPYLHTPNEDNPFLGYRAIRLCLDQQNLFRRQLRALIRAGSYGKLKIMFPMIATVDEFRQAKKIFSEELEKVNGNTETDIKLGVMIEVPSAVMNAEALAKEADFFSIGTNDLTQYTLAVDRNSEKLSYLYQSLDPSILKMIRMTVDAAHGNNIPVGVCGEMANDRSAIILLLGLGVDELSVAVSEIPSIRHFISLHDSNILKELSKKALECGSQKEVLELIRSTL